MLLLPVIMIASVIVFDIALTINENRYSIGGKKIRRPSKAERERWAKEDEAREWNGWQDYADVP